MIGVGTTTISGDDTGTSGVRRLEVYTGVGPRRD